MISNIRIDNFKSIHTGPDGFALRPLNVLIGKNGTGKSNFLKAFDLLRAGAEGRLMEAVYAMGGFGEVRYYGAQEEDPVSFALTLSDMGAKKETLHYSGVLRAHGVNGYDIIAETLEREIHNGTSTRSPILAVERGEVITLKSVLEPNRPESIRHFNDSQLAITQLQDQTHYPALGWVRQTLSRWLSFRGLDDKALNKIKKPQILMPVGNDFRFSTDGEGIISILHALANQSEHAEHYDFFLSALHTIAPDLEKLEVRVVGGGMATLTFRSRHFPGHILPVTALSDGQLRLLALILLLTLPNDAPLITIEEPEVGLHPRMMAPLVELLQIASENTQVIVSTHSAELISRLQPEDVITVENEFGQSALQRHSTDELASWLERYSLGQLWTMGRLTYS